MIDGGVGRPDPEALLRWVTAQEKREDQGRLKVFLGYASGVGKSYRMLDEGRRRAMRGEDVVVGAFQPNPPAEVERQLSGLEVVSRQGELDLEVVLQRKPQVCLVDELAHHNAPGSVHPERWQDVQRLLRAGISVITSVNLQHVRELQDAARAVTKQPPPGETVPEAFLREADEIELVDVPPEVLTGRRQPAAKAGGHTGAACGSFGVTDRRKLAELRELALLLAAEVVERHMEERLVGRGAARPWTAQERFLVCITAHNDAEHMIAAGRRSADRFHGDLFAVFVVADPQWRAVNARDRMVIQRSLSLARSQGAQTEVLVDTDEVTALLSFAREHRVSQILVGHSTRRRWRQVLWPGTLRRLLRGAEGVDIRVFPNRAPT